MTNFNFFQYCPFAAPEPTPEQQPTPTPPAWPAWQAFERAWEGSMGRDHQAGCIYKQLNMANLALSVTVKWKFVIALVVVLGLAVLFLYSSFWKNWGTTSSAEIPENAESIHTKDENVQQKYLDWNGVDKGIFYRKIVPENSKFPVLFLHGARFTSKDWQEIGTLKALSSQGYTVVAVDLPKHGDSEKVKEPSDENGRIEFLGQLIKKLKLERPVVVAPSMSGSYALPFVMNEKYKEVRGFVPIAPAAVAKYTDEDLKGLKLPTLIVYGEKDITFTRYVDKMKEIPGSEVFMMKDASHPCYLDNPAEFHKRVVEFLDKLLEK